MPTRSVPGLTEPEVLAHAKERLYSTDVGADRYAVVDTQFATDSWLAEGRIDSRVRETLAPFNRVRVGSGFPDLVGVGVLESDLLVGAQRAPLIALEAKGYRRNERVDVERGLVQAHDRVAEANAAYLAAPADAITETARSLAQDLNVGVLGVADDGAVEPLEVPRLVGSGTTAAADGVRLQATAQGVADRSFGLNHPKNYVAYPLAVYADGPTADLLERRVVAATADARRGAAFLGLVETAPDGDRLTDLGREVVRFGRSVEGSVADALARFEGWKRTRRRFVDEAPSWAHLVRRIVFEYPATPLVVRELQRLHDEGNAEPTLREFVLALYDREPSFAVELFVRNGDRARERVFAAPDELEPGALADGDVYASPTVFQLKAMYYHAGILTARGAEPHRLDPTADVWALEEPL